MVKKKSPPNPCLGLNRVPPKIHVHPEPQKVNLLRYRVFADIIKVRIEM